LKEAMKFFKMSSDLGNSYGMFYYGYGASKGYLGNQNFKEEAMSYYKMSADKQNPIGLLNYGFGLEKGYLGESNLSEAMHYYKMSAELETLMECLGMVWV
jgi:TPR repeat protein